MIPKIFFAIPCGGFYDEQRKIITQVCDEAKIDEDHRIIIEDKPGTEELWIEICKNIEQADYFMADVSSKRPNIMLELGYALKAKYQDRVAIFISNNASMLQTLSDLSGKKWHKYSSMSEYRSELCKWFEEEIFNDKNLLNNIKKDSIEIEDHFKDLDRFLKLWTTFPGTQWQLKSDGLRFTNSYYPIISNSLGLLKNYELRFKARIEHERIGWIVKGTMDYRRNFPIFAVMFNLSENGILKPHILCEGTCDNKLDYYPKSPEEIKTNLDLSNPREFEVITTCKNDDITVSIKINEEVKFTQNFNFTTDSNYSNYYNKVTEKHGQIGFRCAGWRPETGEWGEVATVNWVKVREIEQDESNESQGSFV